MSFKEIFVGEKREFRPEDSLHKLAKDGWLGIVTAIILGWLAVFLNGTLKIGGQKYFDALVLAVILGIIVRFIFSKVISEDKYVFKIVPGLIVAQILLLPIAIILYGARNFDLKIVTHIASTSLKDLVQLGILMIIIFVLMYHIAKAFKLSDKFAYLLGFGSTVCGASAIAVTAPILKTKPDETASALVINTIVVIMGLILFTGFFVNVMPAESYSEMVGSLTFQTGFAKMGLKVLGNDELYDFGLALKVIRVSLLLFSIPIIAYLIKKKLFIPWYMVLFFVAGAIVSYAGLSEGTIANVKLVYTYLFTASLAAIGLNSDINLVAKNFWKPFVAVVLVFIISIGAFFVLNAIF